MYIFNKTKIHLDAAHAMKTITNITKLNFDFLNRNVAQDELDAAEAGKNIGYWNTGFL